jgi:hypothetical protein
VKPDQTLFWRDLRHLALWIITCGVVGGAAVMFLLMPRPAQAMTIYSLILAGSFALAIAQLRKRK